MYVNHKDIKCGCIFNETKHCYYFPANKVIGKNGFSFRKNTFIYFSQLKEFSTEKIMQKYIDTQKIEHLDTIKTDEYKALVYCAYKGNQVTKRIKLMLEKYLEEMYKT